MKVPTNSENILEMVAKMNKQIETFYGIDCEKEQTEEEWEREQKHDWDRDLKASFQKWSQ